ncbi:hypothetical protein HanPI659440_Chr10g0368741 [Helianthus annuus]|nr:hypothetical protein HanPI659440_Chr10g0368741 [Helianthus annuus]
MFSLVHLLLHLHSRSWAYRYTQTLGMISCQLSQSSLCLFRTLLHCMPQFTHLLMSLFRPLFLMDLQVMYDSCVLLLPDFPLVTQTRQDLQDTHISHLERPTLIIHRMFQSSILRHRTLHHMLCLLQTRTIHLTIQASLLMTLSSRYSFRSTYSLADSMSCSSLLRLDLHPHLFIHHHMLHHHHHNLSYHQLTYVLVY